MSEAGQLQNCSSESDTDLEDSEQGTSNSCSYNTCLQLLSLYIMSWLGGGYGHLPSS